MPVFNPVFLYSVSHPFILVFVSIWLNFLNFFLMFVNSERIVTETAHIELWVSAFHPKENMEYHGNFYHSNITADPSGGTNS